MAGAAIPNSNFLELETFDLSFNLTPLNGTWSAKTTQIRSELEIAGSKRSGLDSVDYKSDQGLGRLRGHPDASVASPSICKHWHQDSRQVLSPSEQNQHQNDDAESHNIVQNDRIPVRFTRFTVKGLAAVYTFDVGQHPRAKNTSPPSERDSSWSQWTTTGTGGEILAILTWRVCHNHLFNKSQLTQSP
jgi:hypothetical protein